MSARHERPAAQAEPHHPHQSHRQHQPDRAHGAHRAHRPAPPVALGRRHRLTIYIVGIAVWLSGAAWLYLQYLAPPIQSAFGAQTHPSQPLWLKIHGAAAMASLLVLGSLLAAHVPGGWRRKLSRPSGGTLIGLSAVLVLTAWGLYYAGDEQLRSWLSVAHWALGLPLPLLLVFHVTRKKRRAKKRRQG